MSEYGFHYDPPSVRDCDSEIAIQKAMRQRIAMTFRHTMTFSTLNGARLVTNAARAKAKSEGMVAGVADLIVVGFPKLIAFCEVKALGSLTSDQREFLETMAQMGHFAGCFRSQDTLAAKLKEWGFI